MKITELDEFGVPVIKLEGRVDSEGIEPLRQALLGAVSAGKHKLILDMAGLTYINSAGLRILAEVVTENRENGGDVRLVGLTPKVHRVFEIIGFTRFFTVYNSVLEAMDGF